ncbi:MAG: hydrolase [Phycisphaerae bacterium]
MARWKGANVMAHVNRLNASQSQLLVIDVQERLLPHIAEQEAMLAQLARMVRAARVLGMPCTLSEQYVKGLGPTAAALVELLADAPRREKLTFSAWRDEALRGLLTATVRPQVLLTGIEAHVCVQQTAFDLLDAGLTPFVLADAVSSRRERDRDVALARMRCAGAVVTTVEAAIFEMLDACGTERFKQILPIVK